MIFFKYALIFFFLINSGGAYSCNGPDMLVSADRESLVEEINTEEKSTFAEVPRLTSVSSPAIIFPVTISEDTVYIDDKAVENLLIRDENMDRIHNRILNSILLTFLIMGMGVVVVAGTYFHLKNNRGEKD